MFFRNDIRGMRGFGSMLGSGIMNGFLVVAGAVFEVVGVDLGGTRYWGSCVCRISYSSLVKRML
jgi:hypothetical protein